MASYKQLCEQMQKMIHDQREEWEDDTRAFEMTNDQMQGVVVELLEEEGRGRHGGSSNGRRSNIDRRRIARGIALHEDYFSGINSTYNEEQFRRRYRMRPHVFNKVMTDICNYDSYFVQKNDACGVPGLFPEQKLTAAVRMLAYGASADQLDEIVRMGSSTTLECLNKFCSAIQHLYGREYLRRPNAVDLQKLTQKGEKRGFPGMIGSIDCMHWVWKNCPSAHAGAHGNRKGTKTLVLEAVASFDTWVWHAFFGVPGAQNDLNVLAQSPVFNNVLLGQGPNIQYFVDNTSYTTAYYLADGIYPRHATFVKTLPNPLTEKEKLFAARQESYRKDVERCFGILQARWAIIRGGSRHHKKKDLRSIMMTCIILHNMIVEDEYDYDAIEIYEPDPFNTELTRIYDRGVDARGRPLQHEPLVRDYRFHEQVHRRYAESTSTYTHDTRQNQLINHLWNMEHNR